MLNSIKTLKRYRKATLNMFKKKNFDDDNFFLFDRFFESNRNFSFEHVKIVQIPGFSRFFSKFL